MAGGDGSLATVAAVAAAHGLPFVCIPAGTRNHFALDLGVDRRDVAGALDAFTDGVERLIDVGEVNGRIFLNNVSLGIYGEAVQLASYRDTKVRTLAETAHRVLGPSGRTPALRLVDDTGREHARLAVAARLQQPVRADRSRPRHSTHPRQRPTGNPRSRHTRRDATPSGASLERSSPARSRPPRLCTPASTARRSNSPPRWTFAVRPAALRVRISARHPGASPAAPIPSPSSRRDAGAILAPDRGIVSRALRPSPWPDLNGSVARRSDHGRLAGTTIAPITTSPG